MESNLWHSLALRTSFNKYILTTDFGYRSCDHFTRQSRTALGRILLERSLESAHRIGIGFACFEHFKASSKTIEYRPFVQYTFEKSQQHVTYRIRFRDELRIFQNEYFANRGRLQGTIFLRNTKKLQPFITAELFYTPGKHELFEQRYQSGILLKSDKMQFTTFYTLQIQSSISYVQHIIGWQLLRNISLQSKKHQTGTKNF